ncbi:heavy metal translocating P-type ATPase [Stomatobaculum longum]|uniref:heavy metal translocating P-type ATPase n=1 Tax=Stomatobaculum longum TaxID=796942 RepID=UPI0028DBA431|nr:heavy metal translocating P-type ATPase [Stomatobaculum longum]
MNRKQQTLLKRILLAVAGYAAVLIFDKSGAAESLQMPGWMLGVLFLFPYLLVGREVILKALKNIRNGQVFDENFLMLIATVAAFGIREYSEACAVMIFYQVGELFESLAVGKSRASITAMMSIAPESANVERDGKIEEVDPDEVEVGEVILIRPGEKVPLDGIVLEGSSFLDTAALTGEPVPREVRPGDAVISGCVNGETALRVKTSKAYEDSTVARILQLVESASEKKTRMENFITRFARWYTPVVTITAFLLAILPPLMFGMPAAPWIKRACIFLIVSCPCALVISVPLGFFGGIGAASKRGVLVKGSNFLETAAELKTLVFDKTGTLTRGEFRVVGIHPAEGCSEEELLSMAAHGESLSSHPIAQSILQAYGGEIDRARLGEMHEAAGHGLEGVLDGRELLLGNEKLLKSKDIDFPAVKEHGTVVYAAHGGSYVGHIIIADVVKPGAAAALRQLREVGIEKLVMLTGDRKDAAEAIAAEVGVDTVYHDLLPADKVEKVEALLAAEKNGEKVGFVGDGINDAPVLMRADVGIAMGSLGSDAAIEAADLVIMDDELSKIADIIRISRKTVRIVRQNVAFALAVKAAVLILGIFGLANMWEAVFGDVGVTVIAVLNAMRALTPPSAQR